MLKPMNPKACVVSAGCFPMLAASPHLSAIRVPSVLLIRSTKEISHIKNRFLSVAYRAGLNLDCGEICDLCRNLCPEQHRIAFEKLPY